MKRPWLILAIAFQIIALIWIAAKREWIVQTGETAFIRTAPIDPRDIFRGDYVRLSYEAATFSKDQVRDGLLERTLKRGDTVYVPVTLDKRGLIQPMYVTDIQPEEGPFLRGHISNRFYRDNEWNSLQVKYGIEQYFVQQGKGLEIEKQRGTRTGIQVPMEMELALSQDGTAIIKGHRWSPLGIGLNVKQAVAPDSPRGEQNAILELTLQNASDQPLSLIMLPNLCSFNLVSIKSAPKDLSLTRNECQNIPVSPEMLVTFSPGEERNYVFDFNQSPWLIEEDGKPITIGTLDWGQRFRLIYRIPDNFQGLSADSLGTLWTGELPSRAFHGRGQID